MKRLLLLLFSFTLFAQDYGNNAEALELCTTLQSNSFSSDLDADNALDRILSVVGLSKNFVLSPCSDINNAVAVSYKGVRYILYDPEFMSMLSSNTSNWTNLFILAHEVGHHVNGHSLDLVLYAGDIVDAPELEKKRQQELEADEFAGFVLAKLGATLSQTTSSVSRLSNEDDTYSTHPNKNKRLRAITLGYNSSLPKIVGKETLTEINESRTTITKSSAGWQYIENNISKRFEDAKVEKEIFSYGLLMPNVSNDLSSFPKISIKQISTGDFVLTISNINLKIKKNYVLKVDDNWLSMEFNARKEVLKYYNQFNLDLMFKQKPKYNNWCFDCPKYIPRDLYERDWASDWGRKKLNTTISYSNSQNKTKKKVEEMSLIASFNNGKHQSPPLSLLSGKSDISYSEVSFKIEDNAIISFSFYIPKKDCERVVGYVTRYQNKFDKSWWISEEQALSSHKARGEKVSGYIKANYNRRQVPVKRTFSNVCWLLDYDRIDIKLNRLIYEVSLFKGELHNNIDFEFYKEPENSQQYLSFDLSGLKYDLIDLFNK